ncbi:MAG: IclR family transcriptional regulator C-terminal domain-containing protein, partial [Anaerolineae bacterium]
YTLEQSLAEVREQGYAVVHEEFEAGFSSVAAPVFNHAGQAVAAVSVSGPTYRMEPENLESLIGPLRQVTYQISAQMGYLGTPEQAGFT